mgnify:CR=1 FL=1
MEIDFVVTWVDMDDPKWKNEYSFYIVHNIVNT